MNRTLATIIGIAIGTAVGGAIVYTYLNAKYSKVIEIETQDYIDEIKELKDNLHNVQKQVVNNLNETKEKMATSNPYTDAVVIDPDQISMDDIIGEDDVDDDEPDVDVDNSNSDIRYISMRDYEDDEDYEKEVIKYFSADGVILQDEEILEADEFINVCGRRALNDLQRLTSLSSRSSGKDNELYIRNEEYNTDYKVIRLKVSYQKYISRR